MGVLWAFEVTYGFGASGNLSDVVVPGTNEKADRWLAVHQIVTITNLVAAYSGAYAFYVYMLTVYASVREMLHGSAKCTTW